MFASFAGGFPSDAGDPALNSWIMWWNAQVVPLTERWWNAPIFVPMSGAFALSESLLGLAWLTTPLIWAGLDPVATYNVAFLTSYLGSAVAAHALAYQVTGRHDAALIAGLAFGFSPYRAAQMSHIQVLWAMWMPLCLLALHRYVRQRDARYLLAAAGCWFLNGLTSGYYLAYFPVLVGLWMLWFLRSWRDWVAVGAALAVPTLAFAPLLGGYVHYQDVHGLSRALHEVSAFSADLSALWATVPAVLVPSLWTFEGAPEAQLYGGVLTIGLTMAGAVASWRSGRSAPWPIWRVGLLAMGLLIAAAAAVSFAIGGWETSVLGIGISLRRPLKALFVAACFVAGAVAVDRRVVVAWRQRSALAFYALAAIVMFSFAMGPVAHAFGTPFLYDAPYFWLMQLPGIGGLRVPARFGMLAVLCLSLAAAVSFKHLTPGGARRLVVGLVAVVVVLDGWVPHIRFDAAQNRDLFAGLTDRRMPVLELPIGDVFAETEAMMRATEHRHPLINGFSGYAPVHYRILGEALNERDPSALVALRQHVGAFVAIVRSASDPRRAYERYVRGAGGKVITRTPAGVVLEVPALRTIAQPARLPDLVIDGASGNAEGRLPVLLDGDPNTWWEPPGTQRAGDVVTLEFREPVRLARLEMDLGPAVLQYPRRLVVDVLEPGQPAINVADVRTAGLAVLGALEDNVRVPIRLDLDAQPVGRRFRLETAERHRYLSWAVADIRAYGWPATGTAIEPAAPAGVE